MRFTMPQYAAASLLNAAGRAAGRGLGAVPGVRLAAADGVVTAAGFGGDFVVEASGPAEVAEAGEVVVGSSLISALVAALPSGALEFSIEGVNLAIAGGGVRTALRSVPAEEFPRAAPPAGPRAVLPAAEVAAAIGRVAACASRDPGRGVLCGVRWVGDGASIELGATDTYRLAAARLDAGVDRILPAGGVVIPASLLGEVGRHLGAADGEVGIASDERRVGFWLRREAPGGALDLVVSGQLLEGRFPDYAALLEVDPVTVVTIDAAELTGALERARLLASGAEAITRVALEAGGEGALAVTGVNQALGETSSVLACRREGPAQRVLLNPRYLLDVLAHLRGEVRLTLSDPLHPVLVTSPGLPGGRWIIMPVRA